MKQTTDQRPATSDRKIILIGLLFLSLWSLVPSRLSLAAETATILEEIPVQHAGRVKPFQSFANETVLDTIGAVRYENYSATELMWQWMARPEEWSAKAIIPVPRMLREEFALMAVQGKLSPEVILNHKPFIDSVQAASEKRRQKEKLTPAEMKRMELYNSAAVFQEVASGQMPGFVAHPEDPRVRWLPLQGLLEEQAKEALAQNYPLEKVAAASKALAVLLEGLRAKVQPVELASAAGQYRAGLRELMESRGVYLDKKHLHRELLYNRLHPFGWAWKFYGISAIFFFLAMLSGKKPDIFKSALATGIVLWTGGFLAHSAGFLLRCVISGRAPVTNMYESVVWVSWAAVFFALILFAIYRAPAIAFVASLVGALALLIADSFPAVLDPAITPLVPVLRSNLWLTVHVLTITMSYGAFALAWGLGHAVVIGFLRDPLKAEGAVKLSGFLYRALQIGVILLAAGTVLGGVWANYSWGRFWGWDPKETWALIALLGYLVVLHGRFAGWLDTFGAAVGSVIAFAGVVMAWYGVNYVLAAGLHSYGFGGGGAVYVLAIAAADIFLILGLSFVFRQKVKKELLINSK